MGHYLGLRHTFNNTSELWDPETNCAGQGDALCDTPANNRVSRMWSIDHVMKL